MMQLGLKPVYVFDGRPPEAKAHEVCCYTETVFPRLEGLTRVV